MIKIAKLYRVVSMICECNMTVEH